MFKRLGRDRRGDTIIEVMIAIAVVSLVLVTAYVATRHSLQTVQDTQEHSEALQLLQSQIEFIRGSHTAPPQGGCFYKDATASHSGGDADCTVDATGTKGGRYTIEVTSRPPNSQGIITYAAKATWDSLVQQGEDSVTLYYQQYGKS